MSGHSFKHRQGDLRRELQGLGCTYALTLPLQELLLKTDRLWRAILEVRRGLGGLVPRGAPSEDFYALAARVYAGRPTDSLCSGCLAAVASHARVCPFCAEPLEVLRGEAASVPTPAVETTVQPQPRVLPAAAAQNLPKAEIVPTRIGKEPRKRPPRRNERKELMRQWARRVRNCAAFPFMRHQLEAMTWEMIRSVAAAVIQPGEKQKKFFLMRMPRAELTEWILGNQPQGPVDPGPEPEIRGRKLL